MTARETTHAMPYDDLLLPEGTRLVHIGPPKTGTTAIQRALHRARPELLEHGVCYPGTTTRPRAAGWAVVGAGVPRGLEKPTMEDWHALVREVEDAGDRRVVVSNESFADGYADAVRTIVSGLGGERVHVVHVVRRMDKLLNSHWQQRVQAGLRVPYDEWLQSVLGEPDPKNTHWRGFWRHHDLADVVGRWTDAAGADNVTLIVADEGDRQLLPRLFERFLGLPAEFLQLEQQQSNRSMTRNEIEMLRHLHVEAAERGWSKLDVRRLVKFGVVSSLSRTPRRPDDKSIVLPSWAAKRVAELNDERIELTATLGVRVLGDAQALRYAPSDSGDAAEADPVRVEPEVAAHAVAATVDAALRRERRLTADVDGERADAQERAYAAQDRADNAQELADAAERRAETAERRAERAESEAAPQAPPGRIVEETPAWELAGEIRARVQRRLRLR